MLADENSGGISYTRESDSVTWLKRVTFSNNTGAEIVTDGKGQVFSSEPGLQYYGTTEAATPKQAEAVPTTLPLTPQLLTFQDPWLLQVAKVNQCPSLCPRLRSRLNALLPFARWLVPGTNRLCVSCMNILGLCTHSSRKAGIPW